ncbi:MAG: hypothetical protein J0I06_04575 [Planctomycetes bacterium]|nr:hypothetical protein [Planctomycetota bacterium]
MRRRMLIPLLAVMAVVGCERFSGPLETHRLPRADSPGYTIEEQKQRGRERNSVTEDDFRIGPKGYIDRVSPTGR